MILGIDISVLPLLKLVWSWSAWKTLQHPSEGRWFPVSILTWDIPCLKQEY